MPGWTLAAIPAFLHGRRFLVSPAVKGFTANQRAVNPGRYLSIPAR